MVKSLLVSLLQYQAFNSEVPRQVYIDLKKISNFIWSGRSPKIAYSTLVQGIHLGGLKLADLETRVTASRLKYVKHIMDRPICFSKAFAQYIAKPLGLDILIHSKPPVYVTALMQSPFYSEVLTIWNKHHGVGPSYEAAIRGEVL